MRYFIIFFDATLPNSGLYRSCVEIESETFPSQTDVKTCITTDLRYVRDIRTILFTNIIELSKEDFKNWQK